MGIFSIANVLLWNLFKYQVEVPVLAPTLYEFVHDFVVSFLIGDFVMMSTWLIIKYRSYTVLFTMSTIVIRRTASLGVLVGFIRLNGSRYDILSNVRSYYPPSFALGLLLPFCGTAS